MYRTTSVYNSFAVTWRYFATQHSVDAF